MNYRSYDEAYRSSINNPDEFWADAAEAVSWVKKWDSVIHSPKHQFYRWFEGAQMNTCYNAVDRHVERGRKNQTAVIYDSPVTGVVKRITYGQLLDEVALVAGMLKKNGVEKGDRVIIYMPMIPETLFAMLACARIGAIHSVVFGGFAPNELAIRIDDAKPKVILSASCGIEPKGAIPYKPLLDKAIELCAHKPEKCFIFQRPQVKAELIAGRDMDWQEALKEAKPAECTTVRSTDPLYILYTSGTTGIPKGVVRDNGGHAVALLWSMKNIYGIEPGDVYWAASDVGWVVGHSYIVYAPLLYGATTIIYEGKPVGTPDPGAFWRVINEHKVKVLFTAPTAFRAIKKEDPSGSFIKKYDISCLKYLFLAGERLDPDTYHWAVNILKIPVIDHWWQTETGWAIAANCIGIEHLPVKAGSPTKPVPGYNVKVLDENGEELPNQAEGTIAIKLPLPPGCLTTLWEKDDAYVSSYLEAFSGYYTTGDGGFKDKDGYIYIMGRVDDIINVAGHRLSTGGMEEVVAKHPSVAECAVIGVDDQLKGQVPVGFAVLKAGVTKKPDEIQKEIVGMIRNQIGALACLKDVAIVGRLPKTRSGKILRSTMRKIADGKEFNVPSTIEDPAVLGEIQYALKKAGYPKK
ncbi:MAG: propionyl-CoA synthetase [Deltaproteobacteria bacterium]|nr:propionyl-CoA synthetase [Deltaproteobacteria bacterium]